MGLFGDGSRKAARRAARLARINARQGGRSSRAEERQDARASAYKAGIDPNAFISDSISKVADVAGRFANPMAPGGKMSGGGQTKSATTGGGGGSSLTSMTIGGIPLVAILAGVFLLKKRKR